MGPVFGRKPGSFCHTELEGTFVSSGKCPGYPLENIAPEKSAPNHRILRCQRLNFVSRVEHPDLRATVVKRWDAARRNPSSKSSRFPFRVRSYTDFFSYSDLDDRTDFETPFRLIVVC